LTLSALDEQLTHVLQRVTSGELDRDTGLRELAAIGSLAARTKRVDTALRAWVSVAHLEMESGSHLEALRALEAGRPLLRKGTSTELQSDFLFIEAELYRSRGATVDAATVAIRHISNRTLQSAPSYFKAFQSLISSYIDECEYMLAAHYAQGVRGIPVIAQDSWRAWPFYLLEAGAYASLALSSHPLYADALTLRPVSRGGLTANQWLEKAESIVQNLEPDATWSADKPEWAIQRRADVAARLIAAINVQRHGLPAWDAAQSLTVASLDTSDIRMAMVAGQSWALSMVQHGHAQRAISLLDRVLAAWGSSSGGDFLLGETLYLLSRAHEAAGDHQSALRAYQRYVRSVEARAFSAPALARLPSSFFPSPEVSLPTTAREHRGVPTYLKEALALIETQFDQADLGVNDLALRVGVTSRTLLNAFRHYLATSPARYIQEKRLEHANVMLTSMSGALGVAEVAERCGFAHMSRFAAAFRRRFGVSPSERLSSVKSKLAP
jgi:AraC-like DNA-binding protein